VLLRRRRAGRHASSRRHALVTSQRPNLLRSETLPPEPRQRRSREKRARLKHAALDLFHAHGYERTSIEEIARRADLATGTFYQHYRSKRQLLLVLMEDLLAAMERLNLRPTPVGNARELLYELLARGFAMDRRYLGAYRAWQEALLSDPQLALDQMDIRIWTTSRVVYLLTLLQQWPGARKNVEIPTLAEVIDTLCWSLLDESISMARERLNARIDAVTHLIYHAMFEDPAQQKAAR
jgi:AcrR family transcriptional regulator